MKKFLLFLLIFIVFQNIGTSQYYSSGQDRATLVWRQIETDKFQLVYPEYFEKEGQRLANILTLLYECNEQNFGVSPKKVAILLHTESAKSNGYVAFAPRRSEMYTTSPNGGEAGDWLTHLAAHEFRHVVQLDKLNEALPKLLTVIFGEQIVPAILGYKVPMWFMEGDAVLTETLLSDVGRGRSAEFLQVLKAYLLRGENWAKYDKMALGSYKDFTPNIYEFGYPMVAMTRKNYGKGVWSDALHRSGKKPFPWKPFVAGNLSKRQKDTHRNAMIRLYNENMTELQEHWAKEKNTIDTTKHEIISPKKTAYTDYQYPQIWKDGSVIAYKQGYDDYGQIVRLRNGKETLVYTTGMLTNGLQLFGDELVWTERQRNVRWAEKSKTVVCFWNVKTQKKETFKFAENLTMPSLSADNSLLVAVQKNKNYTNELLVINRASGEVQFRYDFGTKHIAEPKFVGENKIACFFTKNGAGLAVLDLQSQQIATLIKPHNVALKNLSFEKGKLYFSVAYEGKNDIYTYDLQLKKLQKLTEVPFGAYQPSVGKDALFYANHTANGYEIAKMSLEETLQKSVLPQNWQDDFLLQSLKGQGVCEGKFPERDSLFISEKYKKWQDLFNFHSRSPFATSEISSKQYDLGVSTSSQNLLSTMFTNVGYRKESGYKNGQIYGNLVYKGWFPIISTEVSYGKKVRNFYTLLKENDLIDTALVGEKKNRWEWDTQIRLPFNISRGKYTRNITFSTTFELTKDVNVEQIYEGGTNPKVSYKKGNALGLNTEKSHKVLRYKASFSNLHKQSYRDLQSPWGQQLFFTYKNTPFDRKNIYSYAAEGVFYLPSFAKHHGIKLYAGFQKQSAWSAYLKNTIAQPRGTAELIADKQYTLMTNYKFPLAYPDWSLGRVLYVKRIKTNLFYDYSKAELVGKSRNTQSYGVEITGDTHLLQMPLPVNLGFRVGYETQSDKIFYGLLFSLNI